MASARAAVPRVSNSVGTETWPLGRLVSVLAYKAYERALVCSFNAITRQLARVVGLAQASSVIPVVRCRLAESAIVTQLLVPLKERAGPNFPPAVQVAPVMVPVLPLEELSATVVPLPSLKA